MATRALNVVITGDSKGFNKVLDQTESRTKRWGGVMSKSFALAGAAAAGGLVIGLKKSADAAIDAEKAQATMVAQLKASGIAYKDHAKHIDEVIQKTSKLSGLDDEDLQRSFTNIVRVTGDVNKSLKLTGLAADFARAKHIDVAKAGEIVGKVAGGNTGILSRYGIQIEKGASASDALAKLQQKFAGQAEAYGKTTAGSLDRAGVASENLGEVVGAKLTPLLAKGATVLVDLIDKSGQLAGPIRTVSGVVKTAFDTIRNAFGGGDEGATKFGSNVREMVGNVVALAKRLWAFLKVTFSGIGEDLGIIGRAWLKFQALVTSVILAISKRTIPIIEAAIKGLIEVVRGVVKIIAGILSGDFSKVWDGVKLIVKGALRALVGVIKGVGGLLKDAMVGLAKVVIKGLVDGLKALPGAIKNAVVAGVKAGVNAAKGAVTDVIGFLNPFGDGIGRIAKNIGDGVGATLTAPGGAVNLMGADPDLLPFASAGARMGLHVLSGFRLNAITSSGNPSYHATGDAIDQIGSVSAMHRFAKLMHDRFGGRLRELISPWAELGIKDGRPFRYSSQIQAEHSGSNAHVHLAFTGPFGDGIGRTANRVFGAKGDGIGVAVQAARAAGFRGAALVRMVAIAGRESRYNPRAQNLVYPDHSIGLWQINQLAHKGRYGTDAQLMNPYTNARAAWAISGHGHSFGPWSTNAGLSQALLDRAAKAVQRVTGTGTGGGGGGGGPHGQTYASDPVGAAGSIFGGTQLERLEASGALAELTDTSADDISVGKALVRYWTRRLRKAKKSGNPAAITAAAQGLKSARDNLAGLTAPAGGSSGTSSDDGTAALTQAIKDLQATIDAQMAWGKSVQATESNVIKKSLTDVLSGTLGPVIASRRFTPGYGVERAW